MKYEKTLKKLCRYDLLTKELIAAAFKKLEGIDVDVVPKILEKPGFEISTDIGLCFITERPIAFYNKRYGRITTTQEAALPLSMPIPLHLVGEGTLVKAVYQMNKSMNPKESADSWLTDNFFPITAAVYFNKYFSTSNSLKDYRLIVFEALEAYYLGMDHIAIMSLIPVFEAGLRNIQNSMLDTRPNNVSADVFERHLRDIIIRWGRRKLDAYIWHPGRDYQQSVEIDFLTHICPQSDVINSFRLYFKNVLYKHSRGVSDGFNRHLIMHMLKNDFNNPSNFIRIFLCLTHITFIESLENQNVPFSWRGSDEADSKVAKYFVAMAKEVGNPRRPVLRILGVDGY